MNMFELHDFLHGKNKPGVQSEIPVNQNIDFSRFSGNTGQGTVSHQLTQQESPFLWDIIKIAGGLVLMAYTLHYIFPVSYSSTNFFERRRLAKKQTFNQN